MEEPRFEDVCALNMQTLPEALDIILKMTRKLK